MATKKHRSMGDSEWLSRLKTFATTGVWPSNVGNKPAPRQKRWYALYQKVMFVYIVYARKVCDYHA